MLKQLLLTRKIAAKRSEMDKLMADRAELDNKREALKEADTKKRIRQNMLRFR